MALSALCCCTRGGYSVVCNISNLDEGDVNLLDAYGHVIASSVCRDGKFVLSGTVDVPCLAYVNNGLSVEHPIDIPVMLENSRIKITGDASKQDIKIRGTKTNVAMVAYKQKRDALAPDDAEGYVRLLKDTFEKNCDNLLGALMISNLYGYVSDEEILSYCDRLPEEYLRDKMVYHYRDIAYARVTSAVGMPFIEVKAGDPDGEQLALSDCVKSSKAVVLMFWAHWARNVESTVASVAELCRRYEKDGVILYSLALDGDKDRTLDLAAKLDLPGYSFVDSGEVAESSSKAYGVDGLPRVVVIDHSGKIVARGIDASDISDVIERIIN